MTDSKEQLQWHEALALALQGIAVVRDGSSQPHRVRAGIPEVLVGQWRPSEFYSTWLKHFSSSARTWTRYIEVPDWVEVAGVDALHAMKVHPDDEWQAYCVLIERWLGIKPTSVVIGTRYRHRSRT